MSQSWVKMAVAVAVFAVGAGLAFRALYRPAPKPVVAAPEVSAAVAERIGSLRTEVMPTPENVNEVIVQATDRLAGLMASPQFGPAVENARRADLKTALNERIASLINPIHDRDIAAQRERGAQFPAEPPTSEQRMTWLDARSHAAMQPIGLEQAESRWIYRNGKRVVPQTADAGYRTAMAFKRGPTRMDIAEDAAAAKLDVIEFRLPVKMTMAPPREREVATALVGFQFAWNSQRAQWIPFTTVIYTRPDHDFFTIPF